MPKYYDDKSLFEVTNTQDPEFEEKITNFLLSQKYDKERHTIIIKQKIPVTLYTFMWWWRKQNYRILISKIRKTVTAQMREYTFGKHPKYKDPPRIKLFIDTKPRGRIEIDDFYIEFYPYFDVGLLSDSKTYSVYDIYGETGIQDALKSWTLKTISENGLFVEEGNLDRRPIFDYCNNILQNILKTNTDNFIYKTDMVLISSNKKYRVSLEVNYEISHKYLKFITDTTKIKTLLSERINSNIFEINNFKILMNNETNIDVTIKINNDGVISLNLIVLFYFNISI